MYTIKGGVYEKHSLSHGDSLSFPLSLSALPAVVYNKIWWFDKPAETMKQAMPRTVHSCIRSFFALL